MAELKQCTLYVRLAKEGYLKLSHSKKKKKKESSTDNISKHYIRPHSSVFRPSLTPLLHLSWWYWELGCVTQETLLSNRLYLQMIITMSHIILVWFVSFRLKQRKK